MAGYWRVADELPTLGAIDHAWMPLKAQTGHGNFNRSRNISHRRNKESR